MKLIIATRNSGKLKEIKDLLQDVNLEVLGAEEAGVMGEAEENKDTLAENALKKAKFVVERTGIMAVADDTGLFIDALNGAPGVYSARWAGDKNITEHTLNKLRGIPESRRQARFETVLALVYPDGREKIFKGVIFGHISESPKGEDRNFLPYDRLFIPDKKTKTYAELTQKEKNAISQRKEAVLQLVKYLKNNTIL